VRKAFDMNGFGLYLHIPFCRNKCPYCGFASVVGGETLFLRYARAAISETERRMTGPFTGNPLTVYIGGGTPSCFPSGLLRGMIQRFTRDAAEVTVEANPESTTDEWLGEMLDMGANRISIGVQALDDSLLVTLGRIHTTHQAVLSVEKAAKAGFRRISVDLMFGIPGQTVEMWLHTLEKMIELPLDHVSCYSLSLEEDTPFLARFGRNRKKLPSVNETVEMYRLLAGFLEEKGFQRYELSNFALPGHECMHNIGYWSFFPYLGIGAGAHSFDGIKRTWNQHNPEEYIHSHTDGDGFPAGEEILDSRSRALETLMLSLRTRDGIDPVDFTNLYTPGSMEILKLMGYYIEAGVMEECEGGRFRIATEGVMMADEIIAELATQI